jgi:hypothetical protein
VFLDNRKEHGHKS